jgi:hypothetical protein
MTLAGTEVAAERLAKLLTVTLLVIVVTSLTWPELIRPV